MGAPICKRFLIFVIARKSCIIEYEYDNVSMRKQQLWLDFTIKYVSLYNACMHSIFGDGHDYFKSHH